MQKGIATDTLIKIILGVIVLGLVGYLLYTRFAVITTQASLDECRSIALTEYCPQAIAGGWFYQDQYTSFGGEHPECSSFANELGMDTCENSAIVCGVSEDLCSLPSP